MYQLNEVWCHYLDNGGLVNNEIPETPLEFGIFVWPEDNKIFWNFQILNYETEETTKISMEEFDLYEMNLFLNRFNIEGMKSFEPIDYFIMLEYKDQFHFDSILKDRKYFE